MCGLCVVKTPLCVVKTPLRMVKITRPTNPPTIFERFRRKSTHDFDTISTYDFENDFETLPNDFGYDFETHL